MKNLYDYIQEGILDDKETALKNTDNKVKKLEETKDWCDIIKSAFKHDKNLLKTAEILNKKGIYLNGGDTKNMEWTCEFNPGDSLLFWLQWTVPMVLFSKHNNEIHIEFMCDYERDDYTEKDLLKMYNLSKSEFNELKENIIIALNAKILKTTSGIKYIVKL